MERDKHAVSECLFRENRFCLLRAKLVLAAERLLEPLAARYSQYPMFVVSNEVTMRTAPQPRPAPPPISAAHGLCAKVRPQHAGRGHHHGHRGKVSSRVCCWLAWFAALTAAGGMLSSCATPVGVSPALQGTYWEHALVTNPDGAGPQVVRWGPPQNDIPRADQ